MNNLLRFDNKKTLLFIDFETLNLNLSFRVNRPWQVGMMKVVGDRIVEKHDYHVAWPSEFQIGVKAAEITRFNPLKHNSLKRPNQEIFPIVFEAIESCDYIVGHNLVGFDVYLMYEWYKLAGKNPEGIFEKIIDTSFLSKGLKAGYVYRSPECLWSYQMKLSNKTIKGLKHSLTTMGKELGIQHDYDNLHDALNDLELNVKVWNKLKFLIEI